MMGGLWFEKISCVLPLQRALFSRLHSGAMNCCLETSVLSCHCTHMASLRPDICHTEPSYGCCQGSAIINADAPASMLCMPAGLSERRQCLMPALQLALQLQPVLLPQLIAWQLMACRCPGRCAFHLRPTCSSRECGCWACMWRSACNLR